MIPVKIRNIEIGTGMPKICIPNIGKSKEEILDLTSRYIKLPMDMMEWRVDFYDNVNYIDSVLDVLSEIRGILKEIPLLFTFRTKKEGGQVKLDNEDYLSLNIAAANSGNADIIDVEIFTGDDLVKSLIASIHEAGIKVIASNHDFDKTPAKSDIIYRLRKMQDFGSDILKIAVMPKSPQDVLTLLSATEEMRSTYTNCPLITMSMAGLGSISRISGEVFGSAVTFGSGNLASAPGQIDVNTLHNMLISIHDAC